MDYWGGGGAKGMLAPSQIIGGPGPPLPTPMVCQVVCLVPHRFNHKLRELIGLKHEDSYCKHLNTMKRTYAAD